MGAEVKVRRRIVMEVELIDDWRDVDDQEVADEISAALDMMSGGPVKEVSAIEVTALPAEQVETLDLEYAP